ncbi:MAG: peptide-methionine (S)-S-oxide reductase MsrA [Gemmatimonadaceae bacterium]
MRRINRGVITLALATLGAVLPARAAFAAAVTHVKGEQTVVFAGGCFWGIQSVFQHTKGVITATSGYAGGHVDRPSYEMVSTGRTGHAESVRVVFDPSKISYQQLLRVFFTVAHDPTELNRQGPDAGTQYRSAIFYTTDDQKRATAEFVDQLNKSHLYPKPVVTQVAAFTEFFPAEAHHQNYAELHPDDPYIATNDAPKVVNLRKQFPELYTDKLAAHE